MPEGSRAPRTLASRRVSSGSLKIVALPSDGTGGDGAAGRSPTAAIGTNTRNPASGPATPMSKSARREGIGDLILMNAPSVPTMIGGGMGMKKGARREGIGDLILMNAPSVP